ncbi:multiple sugar transport system permease protein [Nonomuraea thailandensis]|uniref:Multiple sugar transport system permease protein n=1 Tax=Nonomuraea thailandensis TaxID=1188745 RepID=A0A9X2GGV1_9ACTN|nr:carbohydrate ABC transporter permease [Nonomuraea thailandensis]MCP2357555.1 multiple sugar transport system permease protein [Nonomuraea thailandensis]
MTTTAARTASAQAAAPGRRRSPLLTLGMLAFLVYFLLPLFWLLVAATKTTGDLFSSFGLWSADDFALAGNIGNVFAAEDGVFGRWLLNTALYAIVSAGGAALLCALGGYGFAKFGFRGNKALFGLVLGAIMVPSTALAIPTYLIFAQIGLVNTPWAIILPSLVNPFGLYLMRVYAEDAVPDSLLEAARIDGAGELRIFWQVVMRLLAPGFVTVLLFTLVATWNNYFLPLIMLSNPSLYPVTVGLANWAGQATVAGGSGDVIPLVVTGSLLSIIPLVVAFLLLQRYWQSGLAAGGVKQ